LPLSDRELLLAAKEDLGVYTALMWPRFQVARHHRVLLDALERVEQGKCRRLIVCMPPRHGKSLIVSQHFPPWYLGRNPENMLIAATYNQEKASDWGREIRNQMQDGTYSGAFPGVSLRQDSKAAQRFNTNKGGVFIAAGRDTAVTGRGAHVFLIDDPLKGDEEAASESVRERLKSWYGSVVYTRLEPAGAIVIVATRWHTDDLIGYVLREHAHENWQVIDFPAINAAGEALWPDRFPLDRLEEIKRTLTSREWSSLYQQSPVLQEGALFRVERIGIIPALPAGGIAVRAWDLASTAGGGDWTVGGKIVRHGDGRYTIADVVRLQGGPAEVEAAIVNTATQDGRAVQIGLPQDPGQAGKSQVAYFTSKLAGYRVISSPETGSKETRAGPLASQAEVGNVSLLAGPWNRLLLDEMRDFPAGRHDDQVDALSRAFGMLVGPGPITFSPGQLRRM